MTTTIFTGLSNVGNKDTQLLSVGADRSFGDAVLFTLGSGKPLLFRFDLTSIPTNAIVSSAIFSMRQDAFFNAANATIHEIITNWGITLLNAGTTQNPAVDDSPTWNEAFAASNVKWAGGANWTAADYNAAEDTVAIINNVGAFFDFACTAMVQNMVSSPATNFGMVITTAFGGDVANWDTLDGIAAEQPYLTVTWEQAVRPSRQSHISIRNAISIC